MTSRRAHSLVQLFGLVLAIASSGARAEKATPELDAERDRLISQLVGEGDAATATRRFKELLERRDAIRPTSYRAVSEAERRAAARTAWRELREEMADAEVAWRCRLSADPAHPRKADGWPADWGRVVRREEVVLPRRKPLEDDERWTLFEVQGRRRAYQFRGAGFGLIRRRDVVEAKIGDLMLICSGGGSLDDRRLPERWNAVLGSGFAVHLSEPPRIAAKKRWDPTHVTPTDLFWVIHDSRWKFGEGEFIVGCFEVLRWVDGRAELGAGNELSFLVEVPSSVAHRELLVPGREAWLVLGSPRFDASLKKLVLRAEDIEERYVEEVPP